MSKIYTVKEREFIIVQYEIQKETENQYMVKKDYNYIRRVRKSEMYDKFNDEKYFETMEEAKEYLKYYTIQTIMRNEERIKRLSQQNIELKELLKKEQ